MDNKKTEGIRQAERLYKNALKLNEGHILRLGPLYCTVDRVEPQHSGVYALVTVISEFQ